MSSTAQDLLTSSPAPRTSRTRRYLMCRPTHFDVTYSINPWMRPEKPTTTDLAVTQWEELRGILTGLGHDVRLIDPIPGLPDMVFAANGATVVDGTVLSAKFRYEQRSAEGPAYRDWLAERGYTVHDAQHVNEGEGDFLFTGTRLLAGTGFRTVVQSHVEAEDVFGREVLGLTLVDPRFYHLDTALAVLDDDEIMYYPAAFSESSRRRLEELYPDAVIATDHDAEVFGLNAVSDGRHVVMAAQATELADKLRERGFEPIGVELSELLKSGGSAKCCTLELRDRTDER
ncbi:dimethylargininase [Streptomyces sp. ISL-100]|uniref:dimethylargininase n=1 Tax=Streptomyces sp. ISL-100 TaxID=2819173 RepID=UPI001BE5E16F|nr:dimethylargininase [Streptomyces sp. ISL-100]MBT2396907.1 amidinotransferase [Streptomyces sp. ISL-100]